MGEALDKVTRNLGLNNPPGSESGDKKGEKKEPTLEEMIGQLENAETKADVKEAVRMQLRLRLADMKKRINELEGGVKTVTQQGDNGEKATRWAVIKGKPIEDPEGEYRTFSQAYKVAALEVEAAVTTSADKNSPAALFQLLQTMGVIGGKTDSFTDSLAKRYLDNIDTQLKAAVESKSKSPAEVQLLMGEVASLREEIKTVSDPITLMTRAKALTDSMKSAGLIAESTAGSASIEEKRAQYAHEEKMEELKTEAKYKDQLGKTISSIPERVGRGIASQMTETETAEKTEEVAQAPVPFKCLKCGTMISVTELDAAQIVCPNEKCLSIYTRKG